MIFILFREPAVLFYVEWHQTDKWFYLSSAKRPRSAWLFSLGSKGCCLQSAIGRVWCLGDMSQREAKGGCAVWKQLS